jgi:Zinc carboxypeptidase/Secretion system C-terminal sorting domain
MKWRPRQLKYGNRLSIRGETMKSLTVLPLALLLATSLTMDTSAQPVERYLRLTVREKSELDRLTHVISIVNVSHDTVIAYANETEWAELLKMGYDVVELSHPGWNERYEVAQTSPEMQEWDRYPTYQTYLELMSQFAADFPSLCRLDTIGFSVQGRLILALKISDNVHLREDEPQLLYTSSMHGSELTGYVLLLHLADYLLGQYGQATPEGERVTRLIDSIEIWLNPLFNPDGAYRLGGDTSVSNATYTNAHGINLNRNFPDRINDPINTITGREAETQTMMLWTRQRNFNLSANFHSGARVVNYPWDNGAQSGSYSQCPDDAWFMHVSRTYATPNPDIMSGGFPNGITNGCHWYAIFGGRQDWMYWWNGGREVTIELDPDGLPPGSLLPQYWTNNRESFLAYMEETLKGIRGIVSDESTHVPLRARIQTIDVTSLPVYTDSSVGDYHYHLLPGTYSFVVEAPGYYPDTVVNISVTDSFATQVDVALESITAYAHDVEFSRQSIDTIRITARVENPLGHTLNVVAILTNGLDALIDSMLLADDGLHGDSTAGDGLWGYLYVPSQDDTICVSIRTDDQTVGKSTWMSNAATYLFTRGPLISIDTRTVYLGRINDSVPSRDTTFMVRNFGYAEDSLYLDLDYVNVTPDSAIGVFPTVFALPARDSAAVTFTVRPPLLAPGYYNAVVLITSRFGFSQTSFSKLMTFQKVVTGIAEGDGLPKEYALEQNYPNPFNPVTTVQFSIVNTQFTILKVYDVLGREVATLVNEVMQPGVYTVQFDGSGLASGMYLYRLQSGSFVDVKKFVLLR